MASYGLAAGEGGAEIWQLIYRSCHNFSLTATEFLAITSLTQCLHCGRLVGNNLVDSSRHGHSLMTFWCIKKGKNRKEITLPIQSEGSDIISWCNVQKPKSSQKKQQLHGSPWTITLSTQVTHCGFVASVFVVCVLLFYGYIMIWITQDTVTSSLAHHTLTSPRYLLVQTRFCNIVRFHCYNSWPYLFYSSQVDPYNDSVIWLGNEYDWSLKEKSINAAGEISMS